MDKIIHTREEEEEIVRAYVEKFGDELSQEEKEHLVKTLDINTIEAFEKALDNVEEEFLREKPKTELLVNAISDYNNRGEIVSFRELLDNPPEGLEPEDIRELIDNIEDYEELKHIHWIERDEDSYYFNSYMWTGQYAITAVLLKEKDIYGAIANRVRRDCKIYPRPLQLKVLKSPPYNMTDDEIEQAIDNMKSREEYSDIDTVMASNGGVCIYSTDHMSKQYATALCEEVEVNWIRHQ